jgi:hypothetical protein
MRVAPISGFGPALLGQIIGPGPQAVAFFARDCRHLVHVMRFQP